MNEANKTSLIISATWAYIFSRLSYFLKQFIAVLSETFWRVADNVHLSFFLYIILLYMPNN